MTMFTSTVTVSCKNDTYSSILRVDEEIGLLMSHGFAVSIDVSSIRESGLVKAVKRFCNTAKETGGKITMMLDIDHPDRDVVLKMSESRGRLALKVNDTFMRALSQGEVYGEGEMAVEANSIWAMMARCNVVYGMQPYENYCQCISSEVDLSQFVMTNDNENAFDIKQLSECVNALLRDGEKKIEESILALEAIINNIDDTSSIEYQLFASILDRTKSLRLINVIATGIDSMMQTMELAHGSEESLQLLKDIDHICPIKIAHAPMPRGVRTLEQKTACIKAWEMGCNSFKLVSDDASKPSQYYMAEEEHILKRPQVLDADVVRFQNKKEKWIAFIGLIDGRPYEVFTGIADDEEGIFCPKSVNSGKIIKATDEKGQKRYDFQFLNKRGFKITIEGLSEKFNPEFWNYAKLISGVLRYGMPIEQVVKLVSSLELNNVDINNWKSGVVKALKKYLPNNEAEE